MLSFYEYLLNEETTVKPDPSKLKVEDIKTGLTKEFDNISGYKKMKKPNDLNSEILSITKQADSYLKISNSLRALATELKKGSVKPQGSTEIY